MTTSTAAGMKKAYCQGKNFSVSGSRVKARVRPPWIMMPKMPANWPRSLMWNQAALILTIDRAPNDWK